MSPTSEGAASGPVSIRVVREDGRWFVSPVGTVLDVLDAFVENADERTIYPLIGLGYRLPPDATLTLNQPFQFGDATRYGSVLAFDGQAGQEVVGQNEGGSSKYHYYVSGELYTADGEEVGWVDFAPERGGCCAYPERLPKTGSYRLVILEPLPAGTALTLFDKEHAPKDLLGNDGFVEYPSSELCTSSGGGVECKFGEATAPLGPSGLNGATPTTAVVRPRQVTETTSP